MTIHGQKTKATFWNFMNQNRDLGIAAVGAVIFSLAVSHSLGNLWPLVIGQSLAVLARSRGEGLLSWVATLLTLPGFATWWGTQPGLYFEADPPFGTIPQLAAFTLVWIAMVVAGRFEKMFQ